MLKTEAMYRGYSLFDEYEKMGCEYVDNTPEEIWGAVQEINQRIDGTIKYTPDEIAVQNKYINIVRKYTKKYHILYNNAMYSTNFLLNNPWFLA